jgi:FkbM family methyltransferase
VVDLLGSRTILGKLLRLPLRLIRPEWQIPILTGRARGLKWIAGSGNAGHWLGTFDAGSCRVFGQAVAPGSIVYEIGAFVGYYTLQASLLVGPTGRVFAFEPSPDSLTVLRQHLAINHITNVTVIEAAVGERSGKVAFRIDGRRPWLSGPSDTGETGVQMVSLDEFIQREGVPLPDLVKIDVVGSEMDLLRGAVRLLASRHPPLIMRIHTYDLDPPWTDFLSQLGYKVTPFERADFSGPGGVTAIQAVRSL